MWFDYLYVWQGSVWSWLLCNRGEAEMAESETLSVDTSTENQDDPLQDLNDEQIFQLLEETL